MNFIELTNVTGEKIIVNADHIITASRYSQGGGVVIALHNGNYIFHESYENLKDLLLPYEISFGGDN